MKKDFFSVSVSLVGICLVSSWAHAQHSYLPLNDTGTNQIVSYASSSTPANVIPDRVFSIDVAANGGPGLAANAFRAGGTSPFVRDDSGFFPAGTGPLTANTEVTLAHPVLVAGQLPNIFGTGNILYWDGTGPTPQFGPAPANTTITTQRLLGGVVNDNGVFPGLAFPHVLDGSNTAVAPYVYDMTNANSGRSGHFHLQYDVLGDGADPTNEAPDGLYMIGQIVGQPGHGDSDMSLVIFNKGVLQAIEDQAANFATANIVPEPTTMLLLAIGSGMACIKRRKQAQS